MKVVVAGCGLMGAAAARHLALAGHEVVAIGPSEPEDKRAHRGVFASHYDEGRITRKNATEAFWAKVSIASIGRYRDIERASGLTFFTQVGALMAGPQDGDWFRAAEAVAEELQTNSHRLDREKLAQGIPYLTFADDTAALYEQNWAGHISPRRLAAAQLQAAYRAGAEVPDAVVTGIDERDNGVTVHTADAAYEADAVLVAAGAMTDHLAHKPLGQTVYARTVALFELSDETAWEFRTMPSLVYRDASTAEPYLLPPIRYPDGKSYVKLGGDPVDVVLDSPDAIGDWFRSGGNPEVRDMLEVRMRDLIPTLAIEAVSMDACVTTFTPSGRPVIDWLSDRVAVASGGNGAGAKCSDELGRLASVLVTGGQDALLEQTKYIERTDT